MCKMHLYTRTTSGGLFSGFFVPLMQNQLANNLRSVLVVAHELTGHPSLVFDTDWHTAVVTEGRTMIVCIVVDGLQAGIGRITVTVIKNNHLQRWLDPFNHEEATELLQHALDAPASLLVLSCWIFR